MSFERGNQSKILILVVGAIGLLVFHLAFSVTFLLDRNEMNEFMEIEANGKRYEKSIFWKYQGKIYVLVSGKGVFSLENADVESFRILNSGELKNNVGVDKERVYFANEVIPDLNPQKVYSVGNGYYSDGRTHYFCSAFPKDGKTIITLEKMWHKFLYGKEAQIYPYQKIDSEKGLQPIENLHYFASNGEKVFYKGKSLESANLENIKKIEGSTEYFTDETHVYYQSTLLPISYNHSLRSFAKKSEVYLLDGKTGNIFWEATSLEESYAPYQVIGENGEHSHTLFFVSKEGIFTYDTKEKKQKKLAENCFTGKLEEISPDIFMDEKNLYYLYHYELWNHGKSVRDLYSFNTQICYLDSKEGWEKIETHSSDFGSIWKKEGKYYYFDNLGKGQGVWDSIYEVRDTQILEEFSSAYISQIREWIRDGKLLPVQGKVMVEAITYWKKRLLTRKVEGRERFPD